MKTLREQMDDAMVLRGMGSDYPLFSHAMEANEIEPWPGKACGQALHEFPRRHDDMRGAIPIRCL